MNGGVGISTYFGNFARWRYSHPGAKYVINGVTYTCPEHKEPATVCSRTRHDQPLRDAHGYIVRDNAGHTIYQDTVRVIDGYYYSESGELLRDHCGLAVPAQEA